MSTGRHIRRTLLPAHLLLSTLALVLAHVTLHADAADPKAVSAQGFGYTGRATATYYDGGIKGGNCGFGNLIAMGYGPLFAAGSVTIYKGGRGCGGCYRIQCVDSPYCRKGASVIVPITDLCPADAGWCCSTCVHFDLSIPAFKAIADQVAGHVPLIYTRVPCTFNRNIRISAIGSPYWINLFLRNVAGPGDVASVDVASANSPTWRPMARDWGAVWVFRTFLQPPLRFRITSLMDGQVVETPGPCLPVGWVPGKDYDCQVQFLSGSGGNGTVGGGNAGRPPASPPKTKTPPKPPVKRPSPPAKNKPPPPKTAKPPRKVPPPPLKSKSPPPKSKSPPKAPAPPTKVPGSAPK